MPRRRPAPAVLAPTALLAALLVAGCLGSAPLDPTGAMAAAQRLGHDLGPDGEVASWQVRLGVASDPGQPPFTVAVTVVPDDADGFLATASFLTLPPGGGGLDALLDLRLHLSCTPQRVALNATGPREAAELGGYHASGPNRHGACAAHAQGRNLVSGLDQGLGLASVPLAALLAPSAMPFEGWRLEGVAGDRAAFTVPTGGHGWAPTGNWTVSAVVADGRIVRLEATVLVPGGELPERAVTLQAEFAYGPRGPPQPLPPAQRTPWNRTQ